MKNYVKVHGAPVIDEEGFSRLGVFQDHFQPTDAEVTHEVGIVNQPAEGVTTGNYGLTFKVVPPVEAEQKTVQK